MSFKQVGVVCDTQGSDSEVYEILVVCKLVFMYVVAYKNMLLNFIDSKMCHLFFINKHCYLTARSKVLAIVYLCS